MPDNRIDGLPTWDAPAGYAEDMYWNQSSQPLTIEAVQLLDPHNLVLQGSVLYKMAHASHALPLASGWAQMGREDPPAWQARQRIPGAVMRPVGGPVDVNGNLSHKIDLWEIAVDVTATTPAGGWALGEIVRYKTAGRTYTFEARAGLALGTSLSPFTHSCDGRLNAIKVAFAGLK